MNSIEERIAKELEIRLGQVQSVIELLDDGNTVCLLFQDIEKKLLVGFQMKF